VLLHLVGAEQLGAQRRFLDGLVGGPGAAAEQRERLEQAAGEEFADDVWPS
jgi:hypothetical protein